MPDGPVEDEFALPEPDLVPFLTFSAAAEVTHPDEEPTA